MKNIFILSNSLLTDTFLYCVDYVLNFDIGDIYILEENHSENDNYIAGNNVIICDNIEKAINYSDLIIIIASKEENSIPEKTVRKVYEIASNDKKSVIRIDIPNYKEKYDQVLASDEYNKKPVVINIGVGDASQLYMNEIVLNKIFTKNSVAVNQEFSTLSKQIIYKLSENNYVNKSILNSIDLKKEDAKIIIKSFSIDQIHELNSLTNYINILHPDYCVFCGNQNNIDADYIEKVFTYKYNCLSSVYISNYLEVKESYNQTLFIKTEQEHIDLFKERVKTLEDSILSAIAYPMGVRVLK